MSVGRVPRAGDDPSDSSPDPDLSPQAWQLARLARKSLGHLSPARRAQGLATVRARLAQRDAEPRGRRVWTWTWAIAGLAAVGAAAFVPRVVSRAPLPTAPLAFRVEHGAIDGDGAIRAKTGAAPSLSFVDGTIIELGPGTAGRLASVDARGAHLAIREGSARVSVVPRPQARWLIDAGPFQIAVHGTVFTAAWDESKGLLDVHLEHGLVSVTGPVANGAIPVRTGQRLTITTKERRVLLREDATPAEVASAGLDDAPLKAVPRPSVASASERPGAPAIGNGADGRVTRPVRAGARTWIAALSSGDFEAILADADRDLARALNQRSADEIAALADAARYLRRDDVARRALQAQRGRFPGSARAKDAAFFLGRLDENAGRSRAALDWYDRYLAEAPQGPFVSEALGRKMVAVRALAGTTAARSVATEYLRRFPHGGYAGAAEAMLPGGGGEAGLPAVSRNAKPRLTE